MSNRAAPEGNGKALGKGLGNLLAGDRVAGTPNGTPAESPPPSAKAPRYGRGMETLMGSSETKLPQSNAENSSKDQAPKASTTQPARRPLLPSWFYFAADFLLLAFCSAILFNSPRPYAIGDLLFCAATVAIACFFGLAGLAQSLGESD